MVEKTADNLQLINEGGLHLKLEGRKCETKGCHIVRYLSNINCVMGHQLSNSVILDLVF